MSTETKSALPGEQWRVNLEPIDEDNVSHRQGIVKLVDFDARTRVWSVEPAEEGAPEEVAEDNLIERVASSSV